MLLYALAIAASLGLLAWYLYVSRKPSGAPTGSSMNETESPKQKPLRVLVVDDSALLQKFTCSLLHTLGCETDVVADGAAAIRKAETGGYDLIMMDILMPEMDGLEATRRIRALNLSKQPWVIAMTGGDTGNDRRACIAAGMNDYVQKPIDSGILKAAIRRARNG